MGEQRINNGMSFKIDYNFNMLDIQKSDVGDLVAGEFEKIDPVFMGDKDEPVEVRMEEKSGRNPENVKKFCESHKKPLIHGFYALFRAGKVDLRTRLGKTVKYLRNELINHCGGSPSVAERILIDRIIQKAVKCHLYEMGLLGNPDQSGKDHYLALANSLRHDLQALGIKKRAESFTGLKDYLERKRSEHHRSDS